MRKLRAGEVIFDDPVVDLVALACHRPADEVGWSHFSEAPIGLAEIAHDDEQLEKAQEVVRRCLEDGVAPPWDSLSWEQGLVVLAAARRHRRRNQAPG